MVHGVGDIIQVGRIDYKIVMVDLAEKHPNTRRAWDRQGRVCDYWVTRPNGHKAGWVCQFVSGNLGNVVWVPGLWI